jgi:hypothetical protein
VNGLLTSWKQDNNMIYFAQVPDPTSLPPLPTGTNMVRSLPSLVVARPSTEFGVSAFGEEKNNKYAAAGIDPFVTYTSLLQYNKQQVTLAKYDYASQLPLLLFSEPAQAKTS